MNTIKEYLLDSKCNTHQAIHLPKNTKIVDVQETSKGLMLFAIVNPIESHTDLRIFKICSLDEILYEDSIEYIGNFMSIIGLKHVVEILSENTQ
jgi:hypothetical protein